jgi:hypothetical protein
MRYQSEAVQRFTWRLLPPTRVSSINLSKLVQTSIKSLFPPSLPQVSSPLPLPCVSACFCAGVWCW